MVFFPAFPPCAAAQSDIGLALDKAVSLALENNLGLKKSLIDIASSAYSEKNLWSEIFPAISATASAGYRSPLFSGGGFEFSGGGLSLSAGLGLSLGFNAGTSYSIKNIRLAHQNNLLKYEEASNLLSIQITKLFFSLTAEWDNQNYLEEILSLAQKQHERDQVSFKNGLIRELVLMQSRLAVENARYNLSAARTSYANNLGQFLVMLGMAQDADVSLSGEINVVRIDADAEELIRNHLPGRPDILRARQEIERLEYAARQTGLQAKTPSLNVSVDWNAQGFDPFADALSATARLSIPIDPWIPGTSRSQSVRKAGDSVEKAKLDLTMAEESAKNEIRSLAARLRNSWDAILTARLSLEYARRGYELTEQGFRNGTVESLALEDARNNMANARQRLLQSELSYFNMTLDLSAALNISWKNLIETFGAPDEKE
ncbi:MAG: TolC family protein [Treponema sp.]|jgi:multidrug efflux system outer membrane protein|nr:TolC family protein [Treponema sp.]